MDMTIQRVAWNIKETMGVLKVNNIPRMLTLEDPWRINQTDISCIPQGTYTCKPYGSPKYPNTFEITNVDGRTYVLFHIGNTHLNTEGCVLLGRRFGILNGNNAVLDSALAFKEFMHIVGGVREFSLHVA